MRTASTVIAVALFAAATAASAQTTHNAYANGAEPFTDMGRIAAPALSSTTRAAVKAEYIRARKAGEINPFDNHADVIRLSDLQDKQPSQPTGLASR